MHPNRFSVRVLTTSIPSEKLKQFVEKNQEELLLWCTEEIQGVKRFMNKIGDMDYYTATELVVLRTAEIEVFYEVKSGGSEKNNGRRFGRQRDKYLSRGSSPALFHS